MHTSMSQQGSPVEAAALFESFLHERFVRSQCFRIAQEDHRLLIYRQRTQPDRERPPALLCFRPGDRASWRFVDDLQRLVSHGLLATLETEKILRWDQASLPIALGKALEITAHLQSQLRISEGPLLDKLIGLSRRLSTGEILQTYAQVKAVSQGIGKQFCRVLQMRYRQQLSQTPTRLINIKTMDGALVVQWINGTEDVLRQDKVRDMIRVFLQAHVRKLNQLIAKLETDHHVLQNTLEGFAKSLPPALSHLFSNDTQVPRRGVCLCRGTTDRGLPVEVWLHVRPNHFGSGVGCILSVERGHREFALEAADGTLYYFPPILLCARLHLDYTGLQVLNPVVRQPAGGFLWNHPYSGRLSEGPYCCGEVAQDKNELLGDPSVWATQTFPILHQRLTRATENDLCLERQSHSLHKISTSLKAALGTQNDMQVLYAILELQDIARHGLCQAHQLNESPPRVKLDAGQMLYPIPKGAALPQTLRVYAYRPR